MNRYVRAAFVVPFSMIKVICIKILHPRTFHSPLICMISPKTEITLDNGGTLTIGEKFRMRDGAKLRVRRGGYCKIGKNTSINTNNIIVCHDKIVIGDNVQLSPNVQIYDHDHDFRHEDGLKSNHYKTSPITIGNNVWIGANCVILRGTTISDNCVIGAGCVIKGEFPQGSVIVQKRNTEIRGGDL